MLDFTGIRNYYIRCGYTDMRKQIDGLAALVKLEYGMELDEHSIFLFCGRKADRIKALYWDGTGASNQTPGRDALPMAAQRGRVEAGDEAAIPLAHGGAVHRANESVQAGESGHCLLKETLSYGKDKSLLNLIIPKETKR